MSVINKMLQDLDKKRQPTDAKADSELQQTAPQSEFVKPELQYQQRPKTSTRSPLLLGLILLVLIAPTVWFGINLLQQAPQQNVVHNQPSTALPEVAVSPVNVESAADKTPLVEQEPSANIVSLANKEPSANQETSSGQILSVEQQQSDIQKQPANTQVVASASINTEEMGSVSVASTSLDTGSVETTAQLTDPIDTDKSAQDVDSIASLEPTSSAAEAVSSPASNQTADTQSVTTNSISETPKVTVREVILTKQQLAQREFDQANAAEARGDLQQAANQYLQATLHRPDFHKARMQLAEVYHRVNRTDTAVRVLEAGASMYPQEWEFYILMANYLSALGQNHHALNKLDNIADTSDWARDKWMQQAVLAQQTGQHSIAEAAYRSLVKVEPGQGRWWLGLAYALDSQQLFSQAAQAYRTASQSAGLSNNALQFIDDRLAELGDTL
ncbi:tetratricopeptide repeat protein [Shewanella maritima]|uniref:tetratricopeptide repeat protein n=1 Tax=Shewanella maritima TaxID=2520507 RepID=UPI003736A5F4